jgi:hypothetical protein
MGFEAYTSILHFLYCIYFHKDENPTEKLYGLGFPRKLIALV